MKKQKHGFWVFIFSLIPGAGEMYMGFKKQGISIMLLFWGAIALASITGLGWLAMFLPVIWFYSFFNVHNLKSLSEEEFYSVDDNYILHMDQFSGTIRYRRLVKRLHRIQIPNRIRIQAVVFRCFCKNFPISPDN